MTSLAISLLFSSHSSFVIEKANAPPPLAPASWCASNDSSEKRSRSASPRSCTSDKFSRYVSRATSRLCAGLRRSAGRTRKGGSKQSRNTQELALSLDGEQARMAAYHPARPGAALSPLLGVCASPHVAVDVRLHDLRNVVEGRILENPLDLPEEERIGVLDARAQGSEGREESA